MTKLYLNNKKLNECIINNVEGAIDKLKIAKNIANRISIPNGFYYTTGTKRCINNINSLYTDLENIKNWLSASNKDLTKLVNDIENELDRFSIIDIDTRKNLII